MVRASPLPPRARRLPSGRFPRAAIRRYVDRIVERFHPEKVILFGSHAYGRPHEDSDVDLLVVMPAKNEVNQALRIRPRSARPIRDGPDRPDAGEPGQATRVE